MAYASQGVKEFDDDDDENLVNYFILNGTFTV